MGMDKKVINTKAVNKIKWISKCNYEKIMNDYLNKLLIRIND